MLLGSSIAIVLCALFGYRAYLVHELQKPLLLKISSKSSPEFRNVQYFGDWTVSGGGLCGEVFVPSVRGTGGGFERFIVKKGVYLENESLRSQFLEAGIRGCAPHESWEAKWWWLQY